MALLRELSPHFPVGTEENNGNPRQNSRKPGRDLNRARHECKLEALPLTYTFWKMNYPCI
jgi:hypothetical protein